MLIYFVTKISCRANGRLSQENEANPGKFKPDYAAYCRIRNHRFDLTVAEFKPPNGRAGSLISDKVKLGQQMKVMINKLIKHQVSHPVVGSILVEGNYTILKVKQSNKRNVFCFYFQYEKYARYTKWIWLALAPTGW